jgi:hypothetical protein
MLDIAARLTTGAGLSLFAAREAIAASLSFFAAASSRSIFSSSAFAAAASASASSPKIAARLESVSSFLLPSPSARATAVLPRPTI